MVQWAVVEAAMEIILVVLVQNLLLVEMVELVELEVEELQLVLPILLQHLPILDQPELAVMAVAVVLVEKEEVSQEETTRLMVTMEEVQPQ